MARAPLSPHDRAILELESKYWRYAGRKQAAIREQLDLNPTQYASALVRLSSDAAAAEAFPLVVARLQRHLEAVGRQRRARRQAS